MCADRPDLTDGQADKVICRGRLLGWPLLQLCKHKTHSWNWNLVRYISIRELRMLFIQLYLNHPMPALGFHWLYRKYSANRSGCTHIIEDQYPQIYLSLTTKILPARKRRLADSDTKRKLATYHRHTNRHTYINWWDSRGLICVCYALLAVKLI